MFSLPSGESERNEKKEGLRQGAIMETSSLSYSSPGKLANPIGLGMLLKP